MTNWYKLVYRAIGVIDTTLTGLIKITLVTTEITILTTTTTAGINMAITIGEIEEIRRRVIIIDETDSEV